MIWKTFLKPHVQSDCWKQAVKDRAVQVQWNKALYDSASNRSRLVDLCPRVVLSRKLGILLRKKKERCHGIIYTTYELCSPNLYFVSWHTELNAEGKNKEIFDFEAFLFVFFFFFLVIFNFTYLLDPVV